MKYFINFLKNVKFNSVHNVIHKTFAGFDCLKVGKGKTRKRKNGNGKAETEKRKKG